MYVALKDPLSPSRDDQANPLLPKSKWDIDDPRKPEDVVGTVKRNKIFMSRQIGEVEVVEFVGLDVDGAPVLEAFPSIGLVSVIVGKEAVKLLELTLIGIVKSDLFVTSAVVSREQPSHSIRIYGDRRLVVFLCEMTSKFPDEATASIVDCILDFAHRHKCPMLYSIEGVPKSEKITLPTGEEIELNLKQASQSGEDDEESGGGGQSDELPLVLDDTVLAKLTKREEDKVAKAKPPTPSTSSTEQPKKEGEKDESPKKKRAAAGKGKLARSGSVPRKKGKGKGKDDEEDEEDDIEEVAAELFGDKIHYLTTNIEMAKKLRAMGHIPVVDGIIPGVTGGILAQATLTDEDVTAILCPSSSIFPDPDAAVRVLKLLGDLIPTLDFKKGWEALEKEGEDLKKLMKSLLSGLDVSALKKSGSVPYGMYQ
jgi:predicted ATP-grasp superfamily ATP-dependent carboligase